MPVFGDLPGELSSYQVIAKLNEGLLSQESWIEALNAMAHFVGADAGHCLAWDKEADSISIMESSALSAEANRAYHEHFQYIDPGRKALQDAPIGQIHIDRLDNHDNLPQSAEFYEHFMRPNDMSSYMAMLVDRQEPIEWIISFNRRWGRPFFEEHNAQAMHSLLDPLRVAVKVRLRLIALENSQSWTLCALDHISLPLVVIDDRGAIQLSNTAGSQWISRRDFPLSSPRALEVLNIVREACGTARRMPRTATLTLQDPGNRPTILMAVPIPESMPTAAGTVRRVALLLELGSQAQSLPPRELLRQMFRLTPSEIALTAQLTRGLALAAAAEENGVSRETARTHLKSILRKTGTHRQSELLSLLTGMSLIHF